MLDWKKESESHEDGPSRPADVFGFLHGPKLPDELLQLADPRADISKKISLIHSLVKEDSERSLHLLKEIVAAQIPISIPIHLRRMAAEALHCMCHEETRTFLKELMQSAVLSLKQDANSNFKDAFLKLSFSALDEGAAVLARYASQGDLSSSQECALNAGLELGRMPIDASSTKLRAILEEGQYDAHAIAGMYGLCRGLVERLANGDSLAFTYLSVLIKKAKKPEVRVALIDQVAAQTETSWISQERLKLTLAERDIRLIVEGAADVESMVRACTASALLRNCENSPLAFDQAVRMVVSSAEPEDVRLALLRGLFVVAQQTPRCKKTVDNLATQLEEHPATINSLKSLIAKLKGGSSQAAA